MFRFQTGEILVFNTKGQCKARLVCHTGQIQSLSWSHGGMSLED
jgi:hypothetical protein